MMTRTASAVKGQSIYFLSLDCASYLLSGSGILQTIDRTVEPLRLVGQAYMSLRFVHFGVAANRKARPQIFSEYCAPPGIFKGKVPRSLTPQLTPNTSAIWT